MCPTWPFAGHQAFCQPSVSVRSRGSFKKLQKVMPRNVTPRSDMQRKPGIIAGSHDEFAKAIIRNARTGIFRNGLDDDRFTALDEYFGD